MIGRIVIADRRVKAPHARGKIRVGLVSELIAFDIRAEHVGVIRTEHNLRDEAQVIRQFGRDEQIELAGLKGVVGRCGRVPAGAARAVGDGEDQRIGDRSHAVVEVEEATDLERRTTGNLHHGAHRIAGRGGIGWKRWRGHQSQGGNGGHGHRRRHCPPAARRLSSLKFADSGFGRRQPVH